MIDWRIGLELELLAPPGRSRRDLADSIAARCGGTVHTVFHFQSEPSLVPGTAVFENLTLGFDVHNDDGLVARCVDDLTLQADLDRSASAPAGWFRVVSDDRRMLHLVDQLGRADATPMHAVGPVAKVFGTTAERLAGGVVRVQDPDGSPVCIALPLPGERHRPCELITPPIAVDHLRRLESLVAPARDLGFGLAVESATHVHFDGARLCDPQALRNLIYLWETWSEALKTHAGCNPRCVRLGSWPDALFDVVGEADFVRSTWSQAQDRLRPLELSKYVDLNIKNIVHDLMDKHTVEVRVLPGMIEPRAIIEAVLPFQALLLRAVQGPPVRRRGPAMLGRTPWSSIGWTPE